MGFNDILKKLFGNKAQRDLKEIEPYVEKIKTAYEKIKLYARNGKAECVTRLPTETCPTVGKPR